MSDRQQGTVKWFDNAKGYGFIISPGGEDVFVHYRVIEGEGYRSLNEGQQVEYVAIHGEKGWQATEVSAIASQAANAAPVTEAEPDTV